MELECLAIKILGTMKVLAFGKIREVLGNDVSLPGVADTEQLKLELAKKYPAIVSIKYMIAVDKQTVQENTPLGDQSEVALLPPFSGG